MILIALRIFIFLQKNKLTWLSFRSCTIFCIGEAVDHPWFYCWIAHYAQRCTWAASERQIWPDWYNQTIAYWRDPWLARGRYQWRAPVAGDCSTARGKGSRSYGQTNHDREECIVSFSRGPSGKCLETANYCRWQQAAATPTRSRSFVCRRHWADYMASLSL